MVKRIYKKYILLFLLIGFFTLLSPPLHVSHTLAENVQFPVIRDMSDRVGEWYVLEDGALKIVGPIPIIDIAKDGDEKLHGLTACSCIRTARAEGTPIPYGTDAKDLIPNSPPTIGGLIIFKYGDTYHVAKILSFTSAGFFVVEGNRNRCLREERTVYYEDPFIIGFWSPEVIQ